MYEPGPTGRDRSDLVFVVAHGFTGDADRPHVRRIAAAFARHGAVVTFSFRGHGASGGRSTVGDREVLDLAAAVAWARGFGHARVVTVGFSMGGSVVLRHAALYADDAVAGTDAVVSVSSPARWYYRGTAPMRRLHWLVMRPAGRWWAATACAPASTTATGTRCRCRRWRRCPGSRRGRCSSCTATGTATSPSTTPGCWPSAGDHGELWLEPGMGHAENASGEALLERIGAWAVARAG